MLHSDIIKLAAIIILSLGIAFLVLHFTGLLRNILIAIFMMRINRLKKKQKKVNEEILSTLEQDIADLDKTQKQQIGINDLNVILYELGELRNNINLQKMSRKDKDTAMRQCINKEIALTKMLVNIGMSANDIANARPFTTESINTLLQGINRTIKQKEIE